MTRDRGGTTVRGSVVRSRWDRGWPFGSLVVTAESLTFRSLLLPPVTVPRADVAEVYVERIRMPLFVATVLYVCPAAAGGWSHAFSPARPRHAVAVLRRYGWNVRTGPPLTPLSLLRRNGPAPPERAAPDVPPEA